MGRTSPRTPLIERLWWDLESATWDDQLADQGKRDDIEKIVGWLVAGRRRPGERALDVGCGTGNYALALAAEGFAVTGTDVSPGMLRRARQKAAEAGLPAEFLEGDLHGGLDFPDASFDWILCVHVLQMVREPDAFFHEARRVLTPEGRLVLVAFDGSDCTPPGPVSRRRRRGFLFIKHTVIKRSSRVRFYSPAELEILLRDAGFTEIDPRPLPGRPALIASS